MYKSYYNSPIGRIIILSDGVNVTGLFFDSSRFIDKVNRVDALIDDSLEIFSLTSKWLDRYFRGERPNPLEVPVKLVGSSFSMDVWEELEKIPYGSTITYGDIAKRIAKKRGIKNMSSQAVGHAVGHNPVSIIIPCLRVVGLGGNLTGYGGGIDKKVSLLKLDGVDIDKYFIPKRGNAL